MSLFILNTDHVSPRQRRDPLVTARIENCPIEELAVTVVTAGEQMRGRSAQLGQRKVDLIAAYKLLRNRAEYFCGLRILPFDVMARQLYQDLRSQ